MIQRLLGRPVKPGEETILAIDATGAKEKLKNIRTLNTFGWLAGILIAFAIAVLTPTPSRSEPGYPNRPMRILVPYGAGGVGDLTMRILAQKMTERMGKQIIIENRPGAGGLLAA